MQEMVQYTVDINCDTGPVGWESLISGRLRPAFPVMECRSTRNGLTMRLRSRHAIAYGALQDFADLVGDTLADLGLDLTCGVVRRVARPAARGSKAVDRMCNVATTLTGFDLRPAREVPVLYFYKGLRFDIDVANRLKEMERGANSASHSHA